MTGEVTVIIKDWRARLGVRRLRDVAVFVTLALVVSPIAAHGQDTRARLLAEMAQAVGVSFEGRLPSLRTFGPGPVSHSVSGLQFTGFEMAYPDLWNTNASGSRSCAVPACILVAPLQLPAGALITAIELNACDMNFTKDVNVALTQAPVSEGTPIILATAQTSGFAGCTFVTTVLPNPHTVDNGNNTYSLTYSGADDNTTKLQAVRVFYHLQISPAPAVPTFGDVPASHPFFQFVEALAASGITSGCGGGNYCPADPVTRGQMAVFLSRALGLSFGP